MTSVPSSSTDWVRTADTVTSPETVDLLQDCLDALWAAHPEIPAGIRDDVTLAALEICTNITEHAAAQRPLRVQMEVRFTPSQIDVAFIDDGPPARVDLDSVDFPTDLSERGRGLPLAKAVLDGLDYRREQDWNRWLLTRRLPAGL